MQYKSHSTKFSCHMGSYHQRCVTSQKCLNAKYSENYDGPYSSIVLRKFINAGDET
jgi:hypothetical protein